MQCFFSWLTKRVLFLSFQSKANCTVTMLYKVWHYIMTITFMWNPVIRWYLLHQQIQDLAVCLSVDSNWCNDRHSCLYAVEILTQFSCDSKDLPFPHRTIAASTFVCWKLCSSWFCQCLPLRGQTCVCVRKRSTAAVLTLSFALFLCFLLSASNNSPGKSFRGEWKIVCGTPTLMSYHRTTCNLIYGSLWAVLGKVDSFSWYYFSFSQCRSLVNPPVFS